MMLLLIFALAALIDTQPAQPALAAPPTTAAPLLASQTRLAYDVGVDGKVKNCRVILSSGDAELDTRACRILTGKAISPPPQDRHGRPVELLNQTISIKWNVAE